MKVMILSASSAVEANSPRRNSLRSTIEKNSPYLVQPTGVGRRVVDVYVGVLGEERGNLVGLVG
jgi:hypothetical protein